MARGRGESRRLWLAAKQMQDLPETDANIESQTLAAGDAAEAGLASYRPISPLSLVAVIMAVASPLALITPLLLFVPVVALVCAGLGLREIRASGEAMLGRTLAYVALAVAGAMLTAGPAWWISRDAVLAARGRAFAEAWVERLAQGDQVGAHHLHLRPQDRAGPMASLQDHYAEQPELRREMREFFEQPAVMRLAAAAVEGKADLVGVRVVSGERGVVVLDYAILPAVGKDDALADDYRQDVVHVAVGRVDEEDIRGHWRVLWVKPVER